MKKSSRWVLPKSYYREPRLTGVQETRDPGLVHVVFGGRIYRFVKYYQHPTACGIYMAVIRYQGKQIVFCWPKNFMSSSD